MVIRLQSFPQTVSRIWAVAIVPLIITSCLSETRSYRERAIQEAFDEVQRGGVAVSDDDGTATKIYPGIRDMVFWLPLEDQVLLLELLADSPPVSDVFFSIAYMAIMNHETLIRPEERAYTIWYVDNHRGGKEWWRQTGLGVRIKESVDKTLKDYSGDGLPTLLATHIFAFTYTDEMKPVWQEKTKDIEESKLMRRLLWDEPITSSADPEANQAAEE